MLDDLLEELAAAVADQQAPGFVDRFEEVVERIAHVDEPESIDSLLRFVGVRLPDDLSWSIVHTIERFDDETYVTHLLSGLPELAGRSPQWAQLLVRRVLNDPSSHAVLAARAPDLPPEQAAALDGVRRAIEHDR